MALVLPDGSFTNWPGQDAAGASIIDPAPLRARILLSDGGVYDNHGLEPLVKRYMTILVSDGGAPFARVPEVNVDPIRQLQRVFDVTDNQVRALRRRDLIARFQAAGTAQASGKLGPTQTDPYGRFGTYWGIDTDPAKLQPLKALPCKPDFVDQLAHLSTRLSDLGEAQSKQLINWGYAICDRCVRIHYDVPELSDKPDPKWPYPDNAIG